jgi:hypothetical protein
MDCGSVAVCGDVQSRTSPRLRMNHGAPIRNGRIRRRVDPHDQGQDCATRARFRRKRPYSLAGGYNVVAGCCARGLRPQPQNKTYLAASYTSAARWALIPAAISS